MGEKNNSVVLNLAAGGISWGTTNAIFNGLDVLRIRWQVSTRPKTTLMRFFKDVAQAEGLIKGLWAPGLIANLYFVMLCGGVRMGLYPYLREKFISTFSKNQEKSGPFMMLAGFISGAPAYFISCPLFIVKNIHQAQPELQIAKTSILHELSILQPSKVMSGAGVLIFRGCMMSGGHMFGYDYTKTYFKENNILEDTPALHVFASCVGAVCSTALCTPADLIMTKYSNRAGNETVLQLTAQTFRNHGPLGFYRGSQALFIRLCPSFSVATPLYEQVRRLVGLDYLD